MGKPFSTRCVTTSRWFMHHYSGVEVKECFPFLSTLPSCQLGFRERTRVSFELKEQSLVTRDSESSGTSVAFCIGCLLVWNSKCCIHLLYNKFVLNLDRLCRYGPIKFFHFYLPYGIEFLSSIGLLLSVCPTGVNSKDLPIHYTGSTFEIGPWRPRVQHPEGSDATELGLGLSKTCWRLLTLYLGRTGVGEDPGTRRLFSDRYLPLRGSRPCPLSCLQP